MNISEPLAAQLAALTAALENPDGDLEAELRILASDVKAAVASYTAMTMTITLDGHDVSFTVHDNASSAAATTTSLMIPLPTFTSEVASTLLLYAATPGAFVDLAADLSYALAIDPAALVLDEHLPPHSGIAGLDAHFALDQAIGVLIGRGHTPETARDELHRLAKLDHGDLRAAAEAILQSVDSDQTDQP